MIRKLRLKLICSNMILAMGMLLILFALLYQINARNIVRTEVAALKTVATSKLRPGVPGAPHSTISYFTLRLIPTGGKEGEQALMAAGSESYDLSDIDHLYEIYLRAESTGKQTGVLKEYGLRFYRADLPDGRVYAFTDISAGRNTLRGLLGSFVLIGALSSLGFLGISLLLSNWAVKPVAQAWQQQRQFVADASHELKTPLTVILTNAELMQSQDYLPDEKQQFSQNILTMSRQMRFLVESLLELARADNGQIQAAEEPLDCSALLEEAVLPFEPAYFEKGMVLESRIEPGIFVTGDGRYLRQVAEILLDNGLKYADPAGPVVLTFTRQGRGRCLLTVSTRGEPLSAQECKDIFKRFYRRDAARSDRGSYGLGLAIADRIVREHRGKIWAQGVQGGNIFSVSLPETQKKVDKTQRNL